VSAGAMWGREEPANARLALHGAAGASSVDSAACRHVKRRRNPLTRFHQAAASPALYTMYAAEAPPPASTRYGCHNRGVEQNHMPRTV